MRLGAHFQQEITNLQAFMHFSISATVKCKFHYALELKKFSSFRIALELSRFR